MRILLFVILFFAPLVSFSATVKDYSDQGAAYSACAAASSAASSRAGFVAFQYNCRLGNNSYSCQYYGAGTNRACSDGTADVPSDSFKFPSGKTCSSRPSLNNEIKSPSPNGTGNVCHDGCTYTVSVGSPSGVLTYFADPTGDVCQANDDTPGGVSVGGGTGGGNTGGGDTGGGDTGGGNTGGGNTGGGNTGGGNTGGGGEGGGNTGGGGEGGGNPGGGNPGGGNPGGGNPGGGNPGGGGEGGASDGLLSQIAGLLSQIKDALTGEGEAPDVGPEGDASEVWQNDDAHEFVPDESGYGGSCPAPPSVTVFGQVITFDNAPVCMWLRLGGWIVLALAALACLRIIATKEA